MSAVSQAEKIGAANTSGLLHKRKWNHEFIDLSEVKNQHKPSFTAEQVPDIIARAKGQSACCFSW